MGFEHELVHYRFLDDEIDTCLLLDYDLSGPDARCTIMGPNGREDVGILSLYVKKEYVPPMEINWPVKQPRLKPNLKPSINNPVYWIWWTIGFTGLALAITVL